MATDYLYVQEGYVDSGFIQDGVYIDWNTKIIHIPKFYLEQESSNLFTLDTYKLKQDIDSIMDDVAGMTYLDPINHNTSVLLGGISYARIIEIINGYTITFEDGQYAVNLIGSNNNIADVTNVNQVSVRPNNSAGLIDYTDPSGKDTIAPEWVASVGVTDVYQDGNTLTVRWGFAKDNSGSEVMYNIYMSDLEGTVFEPYNLIQTVTGNLTEIRYADVGLSPLVNGTTYYVGVRAVDQVGNETTNTNYGSQTYVSSVASATDVNIVAVNGAAVTSVDDFKADLSNIPAEVWAYTTRELTDKLSLTPAQQDIIDQILADIESKATQVKNTVIATS